MKSLLKFNPIYFSFTIVLLAVEILIAVYVQDHFIRPYAGDVLVVILIYCFLKAFLDMPWLRTALAALLFSYTIEALQYFNIVTRLGLEDSKYAAIIIGTSFAWEDIISYTAGMVLVIFFESVTGDRERTQAGSKRQ